MELNIFNIVITREFIDKYEYKLNLDLSRNKNIFKIYDTFPYYNWKIMWFNP